jgi:alkyldihydroxyacetonephosphate synthase
MSTTKYTKKKNRKVDNQERLDGWGYLDSGFYLEKNSNIISFKGGRYQLESCPKLYNFVSELIGITLPEKHTELGNYDSKKIKTTKLPKNLVKAISDICNVSTDVDDCIKASRGQCVDEITRIKSKNFHDIVNSGQHKLVDMVVYPTDHESVLQLIELAKKNKILKLIPVGGSTNVSQSLDLRNNKTGYIVAVSTRDMKQLEVDIDNKLIVVGPGWIGKDLNEHLIEKYNMILGHCPDSWEFSTIGGYIATNASGMKKNTYGNIEDLMIDVRLATPVGELTNSNKTDRSSVGTDIVSLALGSEGNYGIITEATLRIRNAPQQVKYQAYLFRNFETGFNFIKKVEREGVIPASLRMVDNEQFRFGSALKDIPTGFSKLKADMVKRYVLEIKQFDEHEMVMVTSVVEGPKLLTDFQENTITKIAKEHNCIVAGRTNGRRGYALTECIAYIRDFFLEYGIVGESFETTIPWSKCIPMMEAVKKRARELHSRHELPGLPCIMGRISQVYNSSICVYFYYGFYIGDKFNMIDGANLFLENEAELRKVILEYGGSLSHHHGVGKIRKEFLLKSDIKHKICKSIKETIDPTNIFSSGNSFL